MIAAVRIRNRLLLVLALALAATASWGATYRWTDAAGNVVYGDLPPAGVQAELLGAPPPPADQADPPAAADAGASNAAGSGAPDTADTTTAPAAPAPSPEALQRDQQRRALEARQLAEARRKNCAAARNNLETLERNRPLRLESQGKDRERARRVSAEERTRMIREAQQQIRDNCN
jgi:hypothetical protein